ncbi:MAG: hypothetical protein IT289_05875 [Oligoflexia bacterium]|nr:hypothetical protein [Oligoflexia bacterium]
MKIYKLLMVLIVSLLARPVWSQSKSIYSFSGGCSSQGSWTQKALVETQSLINHIQRLESNEACKGIGSIARDLESVAKLLSYSKDRKTEMSRLESLPQEISAVSQFVRSESKANALLGALGVKNVESAALSATAGRVLIAAQLVKVAERGGAVTRLGVGMLQNVFKALPQYDTCLEGNPGEAGILLGTSIQLLAAFGSGQEGVLGSLGDMVHSAIELMRRRHFSKALRSLNQTQLRSSLSCLVESVTESYCKTYDARVLIERSRNENIMEFEVGEGDPFYGYYVLTRPLSVVIDWIQKLQLGVVPKLSSDYFVKNNVWDNVTNAIQVANRAWGRFFQAKGILNDTLKKRGDIVSQKTHIFELIADLTQTLAPETRAGSNFINFFAKYKTGALIPWYLIGREDIDPRLRANDSTQAGGKQAGMVFRSEDDWEKVMRGDGKQFQPEFENPDALMDVIEKRLGDILENGINIASGYFRQFMIMDLANTVSLCYASQNLNCEESFRVIYGYLGYLENLVRSHEKDGGEDADLAVIPNIEDTRLKIDEILKALQNARKAQASLSSDKLPKFISKRNRVSQKEFLTDDEITALRSRIHEYYVKIVDRAYENFRVLEQRDTFLTTRLSTFVQLEYMLKMRHEKNWGKYENQLLKATDNNLLSLLLSLHQKNPDAVFQDLNVALNVHRQNLFSVETLFRDNFLNFIEDLKDSVTGARLSNVARNFRTIGKMGRDLHNEKVKMMFKPSTWFIFMMQPIGGPAILDSYVAYKRFVERPDLYQLEPWDALPRPAAGDKGAESQVLGQLCIQTLAFESRSEFAQFCKGSVLKGYYKPNEIFSDFDVSYDKMTNFTYLNSAASDLKRVCAIRDYGRRHFVYWLSQGAGLKP